MRATIAGHPYSVGLLWGLAESPEDIAERREETGRDHGVVLRAGKRIVGLGLAEAGEEDRRPPPAAAALLALHYRDPVVAIEWAEAGQARYYWLAAVADGAVVPGTDVLEEDPAAVHRHLLDLEGVADYRLLGTASAEFGGAGGSALEPAAAGPARNLAAIRPLGGGSGRLAGLLAILALAVGAAAWLSLQPKQAQVPVPFVDRDAELRREAIAARNRQLSGDLSGLDALTLARRSALAGRHLQRSAAYWRIIRKECSAGTAACTLTWDALAEGATPAGLAASVGVRRQEVGHDLQADRVTVGVPLGAEPEAVAADESTPLTGDQSVLVDLCRRFRGRGGACTVGGAQAPSIPNAALLPPGLQYRTGTIALGGPLGRVEALLPLFAGLPLSPWVRADAFTVDYDRQEFHFEGHYVVP